MTKFPFDETEAFKAGRDVWFEMRGPAAAQAALDQAAEHKLTRDLRQYLFEHCFGAVWSRPGWNAPRAAPSPSRCSPRSAASRS